MKKLILPATLAAFVFIGCSKKNNNSLPPAPATFKEYFRAKINGVVFTDTTTANIYSIPNELQITGFHANGLIKLWLRPYTGMTGESFLNQTNNISIGNTGGFYYAGTISGTHMQGSGKINILEITSSFIRGTFECIAPSDSTYAILPTQYITEGEFKLKKP